MSKTERDAYKIKLICDDPGDAFVAFHDNRREPFRKGVSIGVMKTENQIYAREMIVMLEDREAKQLRDFLINLYATE